MSHAASPRRTAVGRRESGGSIGHEDGAFAAPHPNAADADKVAKVIAAIDGQINGALT
ncbi:hypothetical protein [Pacificibacter marinus]|uniref:hypothetical protein n=1 Tax=Pacificibacter marinus TaxID=658057 RepID=UPI001593B5F6|nr:hypothetical protein [Pacificibacter marinus]